MKDTHTETHHKGIESKCNKRDATEGLGMASPFWQAAQHVFPPAEDSAGLSPFFAVNIASHRLTHSSLKRQKFANRAETLLALLAMLAPSLPDATLLVFLHDGCPMASLLPEPYPFHLAFGITDSCKNRNTLPLPCVPSHHNPLFNSSILDNALAVHEDLARTHPFDKKIPKAVWRGKLTDRSRGTSSIFTNADASRGSRARASLLTWMYPTLVDARAVEYSRLLPSAVASTRHRIPFHHFFHYKYALDINGAGGSFRLSSLLLGNSIVLEQSKYTYFFSDTFRDAVVPVAEDLSDLVPIIKELEANETRVASLRRAHARALASGVFGRSYLLKAWLNVLPLFPPTKPPNGSFVLYDYVPATPS